MKPEERTIRASFYGGLTDLVVGLIMFFTGWHVWYFEHFHFFGMIGMSMVVYALWHGALYMRDTGRNPLWNRKKKQ